MDERDEKIPVVEAEPKPTKGKAAKTVKAEKKASAPKPKQKVHVVKAGDTLRSIAIEHYGTAWKMSEIRKANQLATDFLKVGKKLILP